MLAIEAYYCSYLSLVKEFKAALSQIVCLY